jgi:phage terminase large subunit-like protein
VIENGFVCIPEDAPWLTEYLHEITAFPKGKHDDQADSTSAVSGVVQDAHLLGQLERLRSVAAQLRRAYGHLFRILRS